MSDANIFAILDEANKGEVNAGQLAADKATNAGVRNFAQRMVRDHSDLRQKGQQLAQQLNVNPTPPANFQMPQQDQALMDTLRNTAKGMAFDTTYINRQVTLHEQTVDKLKDLQDKANEQQLKDLIGKAIPTIQDHLDQARKVQDNLKTRS